MKVTGVAAIASMTMRQVRWNFFVIQVNFTRLAMSSLSIGRSVPLSTCRMLESIGVHGLGTRHAFLLLETARNVRSTHGR